MRLILGLDAPTAGDVRVNGRRYADHPAPLAVVGAMLEARAIHPGRSARNHLLALAATHAISAGRVDQVLALTGLKDVATKRGGSFSLGMGQRLGIAAALLGVRPAAGQTCPPRPGFRRIDRIQLVLIEDDVVTAAGFGALDDVRSTRPHRRYVR